MDALGPSASRCAGSRSSGTMVANIIVDPLSPQKKTRSIGRTRVGHTHGSTIVDHTSIYNFQISLYWPSLSSFSCPSIARALSL